MRNRDDWTGPVIRLVGMVLLSISALAWLRLFAHRPVAGSAPALSTYCLALIAFACASAGSAMTALGIHLLDRVEISSRWRRRDPTPPGKERETFAR